jgi:hypothetical protein
MIRRSVTACILGGALLSGCAAQLSGDPRLLTAGMPVGDVRLPVTGMEARRFETVVRQRYDFSCGSAALATLLSHHYGIPRDEEQVFLGMWRDGDRAQIRRVGFSLLDMKRYLEAEGLKSEGFRVPLDAVARTAIPGIALVTLAGYRHFVVVRAVSRDRVLVADPSLGLRTLSRREFETAWNGIYFVINERAETGRSAFGATQWADYPRVADAGRLGTPLSLQELYLTAPQVLGGPLIRDF